MPRAPGVSSCIRWTASRVIRNHTCSFPGSSSAPNQKVCQLGSRLGSSGLRVRGPPGQSSRVPRMTIAGPLVMGSCLLGPLKPSPLRELSVMILEGALEDAIRPCPWPGEDLRRLARACAGDWARLPAPTSAPGRGLLARIYSRRRHLLDCVLRRLVRDRKLHLPNGGPQRQARLVQATSSRRCDRAPLRPVVTPAQRRRRSPVRRTAGG